METKYIKTLNHIKRCNEIDGLDISEPPLGLTAAQYRASCRWLKDNDYIYAAFVEGGGIEDADLRDDGQAALDDYHNELMERMKPIATDFELGNLGTLVLGDIDDNIFCREPDSMEKIEALEGILRIASSKVPGMEVRTFMIELLSNIDKASESSSSADLCFDTFVNLVKIYTVLRYRFRDNEHYCTFVYPALIEAMDDIRTKPETILGKYKEKLSSIYKRFFRNTEEIHSYVDNMGPHFDEDKVAERINNSNIQEENNNMHSDEEHQALLNKIQELEAENKRLKEENAELGHQIEKSTDETEEDRTFLYDEVKKNMYTGKIRACIILGLLNELLNGNITDKAKAAILTMNVAGYGSWGALEKFINNMPVFHKKEFLNICREVNCMLDCLGVKFRLKYSGYGKDAITTPTGNWDEYKNKYSRNEKTLPKERLVSVNNLKKM